MPQKDSFVADSFAPDAAAKPEPAKGYGDASGNYTREMSAAQIAGNQFLNALEGMGVDPQHPIVGTIKNFIKGGGDMVEKVQNSPVMGTLGAIGDIAMAPVHAIGNVLSGNDEQAARGAGQFLASTPIAAAELGLAEGATKGAINAIPSAKRAGTALEEIKAKAGTIPVNTTAAEDVVARAKELQATGSTMPTVLSKFEARTTGPKALSNPDVPYSESFDFASNAKKLSAADKLAANPPMAAQIDRFAKALQTANREAAESVGMGDKFDAAMKEYRQAMQMRNAADMLKKHGIKVAIGVGLAGEIAKKYLLD